MRRLHKNFMHFRLASDAGLEAQLSNLQSEVAGRGFDRLAVKQSGQFVQQLLILQACV